MEYAGAIDLDPPLTHEEISYVRRLAGDDDPPLLMAWAASRDGTRLRPRKDAGVDALLESLRYLIATMTRPGRFTGMVAVYDADTRAVVTISAANGRVTQRVLRKPSQATPRARSNVIDMASRRRASSQRIG